MGMGVELSLGSICEQRGTEAVLPGDAQVQAWGSDTFFCFCPRKQACGPSHSLLSYAPWVLTYILCYITNLGQTRYILSDRALIRHLCAVLGLLWKKQARIKTPQVLACSVTAQGPIPSAWPAQMWLGLWRRAAELVWVWGGHWATQTPVGEH